MKLVVPFLFLFYSTAYSQELDVLQFVSKDALRKSNIREIRIYSELDEERLLTSKIFLNANGIPDSIVSFSLYDTTHVCMFYKYYYDSIGQNVRTISGIEMAIDFSKEMPKMEMFKSTSEFTYAQGDLVTKKISNPEATGYDSVAYSYSGKQLVKKEFVNTQSRETTRTIKYQYTETGKLKTELWEEKGHITFIETSSYDKSGYLINVHMKNVGDLYENVFTDNCYKYDEKGRRIEWSRIDETSKAPIVYKYLYDANDFLVRYASPFHVLTISYNKF